MSLLFQPYALRGVTLPNRIVISPMCQYSADEGRATDWHTLHLGSLALSGAGLLFIEATGVEPEGRITPGCLGLWDDATEAALRPVLATIRRYSKIPVAIQLAHAGRKASSALPWQGGQLIPPAAGGWAPVAPSAVAYKDGEAPPSALDLAGIARVKQAFVASARRAVALGIDAIELHAAHGYLLHEFLSPLSNRRSDAYGGSLENRLRLPLEIFAAVRAAIPEQVPLGVRISATDWVEGGWDLAQSLELARALKALGVDWIDVSSGGNSPLQKIPLGPGYQVPLAEAIRRETGVSTMAVGLITEPAQAEAVLAEGRADLVALARGFLYDARWPWHAAAALGARVAAPPQYWRAPPAAQKDLFDTTGAGVR